MSLHGVPLDFGRLIDILSLIAAKEPKLQPKRSLTDIFLRNKSSSGQLSTLNLPKAQSSEEIRSLNTHQARPNEKASPRDDRKKRERFSSTMARFAKVPFSRNRVKTEQRLPAPTQSGERVTPQTPIRKIKVYYDGPENMDISTEERLASPATFKVSVGESPTVPTYINPFKTSSICSSRTLARLMIAG